MHTQDAEAALRLQLAQLYPPMTRRLRTTLRKRVWRYADSLIARGAPLEQAISHLKSLMQTMHPQWPARACGATGGSPGVTTLAGDLVVWCVERYVDREIRSSHANGTGNATNDV